MGLQGILNINGLIVLQLHPVSCLLAFPSKHVSGDKKRNESREDSPDGTLSWGLGIQFLVGLKAV